MAEELQYGSGTDSGVINKRKYEDQTPPPSGAKRQTGFSALISSQSPPAPQSYNSVPPPSDEIQLAKQKAQEIAARLFNSADPKRPKVDNGGSGFDSTDNKGFSSGPIDFIQKPMIPSVTPSIAGSYGYPGPTRKIEIPNGRVGVVIGKAGETIKYFQLQSGAKIQVTRDAEADPNSATRSVELMGTAEAIAKAEQLINDVLAEAETGGTGIVSRRLTGQQSGAEQFAMKILNEKVGLVIGKGGETIKSMQARSGARIQVIPLHLPPGDTSKERTVQIDGSSEQIEMAKQLVNEVINNENRLRNPSTAGVYPQQYQARPPTSWAPGPTMQQPGYGYPQQGAYPTQPPYPGYPQQATSGGYATGWDQTTAPSNQQATQGGGYDYYQQQPPQQQQPAGGSSAPMDNTGYYSQQPVGYNQQGYSQDGYGGYHAPAPHSGYGQPTPSPISGYDQQQGYNAATGYSNVSNPAPESHTPYGAQGDANQAPPAPAQSTGMGQQGYSAGHQPSPNPSYPSQGSSQPGYGMPPTTQAGYGTQPPSGYGPSYGPPAQKPSVNQPGYGQPQQSPNAQGVYGQPPTQAGYQHTQPGSLQSGYLQADSSAPRAPPSSYGTNQSGYAPSPYGAPSVTQSSYGQQQPPAYNSSYGGGYSQPPVYSADGNAGGNARGTYDAAPTSQVAPPTTAKASPPS